AGSFLIFYQSAGARQFDSTGGTANWYWSEWFPPSQPFALVKWLAAAHTGNMMAYPAGGSGGASFLTALLCLLGAWAIGRQRRWTIVFLCAGPFFLTFAAALLHRYPYGGSARVAQHLAPAICMLAGTGAAALIRRAFHSMAARRRALIAACMLLALI